jgi:serine/threonine protein phosphatase 1
MGLLKRIFNPPTPASPSHIPRNRLSLEPTDFPLIYAVGDVHGCYELLVEAERRIAADAAGEEALLVYLGDYVDRGPSSRDVLEHFCRPPPFSCRRITLCGNHDEAFLKLLNAPKIATEWLRFAGRDALMSYGIDASYVLRHGGVAALENALEQMVPARHKSLLESMPILVEIGELIFVHAGIRSGVPLASQVDEDLLWIRKPFLTRGPELPLIVVHGHTPTKAPYFGNGRIGIDTGAYATGNLTVVRIVNRQVTVLP